MDDPAMNIDPSGIKNLAEIGLYHLEAGAREFSAWSKKMIADFGDDVRPLLPRIWAEINKYTPDIKHLEAYERALDNERISNKPNQANMAKLATAIAEIRNRLSSQSNQENEDISYDNKNMQEEQNESSMSNSSNIKKGNIFMSKWQFIKTNKTFLLLVCWVLLITIGFFLDNYGFNENDVFPVILLDTPPLFILWVFWGQKPKYRYFLAVLTITLLILFVAAFYTCYRYYLRIGE